MLQSIIKKQNETSRLRKFLIINVVSETKNIKKKKEKEKNVNIFHEKNFAKSNFQLNSLYYLKKNVVINGVL